MTDLPRYSEAEANRGSDQEATGNRQRWVFVLAILIAIVLVGLMVFLHLTGTLGPGAH